MYTSIFIFTFCSLICVCTIYAESSNPIVETSHGKVKGKVLKSILEEKQFYGFMGIPYAKPPVKKLRFMTPQPIEPWDGVLSATKEKQACVQFNNNIKKGQPLGHYGVEDCLYLDIFTPDLNKRLPLIIFLYNEHFSNSYNKTKDYSPDFFIENDVIIATISHRLSVFGFLSFEDDILSGNSGLKDIVLALEWIRNNIERFGGDSNRITLMGSQGGAAAVDLLIHSKARGLFNSAILQSGTAYSSIYLQEDVRERAFELAEILERGSSSVNRVLKDLNEIPPEDLLAHELEAVPKDYNKEHQRGLLAFGPVVERDPSGLIIEYPENSKSIDIPIMIGFNSREGLESSLQYLLEPNYLGSVNKDFVLIIPRRVKFKIDIDSNYDEAVNEVKKYYFSGKKVTVRHVPEYLTYIGDVITFPIDSTAKFYSEISSKEVYYYHFDYYGDFNENKNDILKLSKVEDGTFGAATGDELCYLFKCPRLNDKYLEHYKSMTEEMKVQRKLVRMWTNFAKYGNPTPKDDPILEDLQWPPFSTETKEYLDIGKSFEVKQDMYKDRFQFWEEFIKKWEQKAVDGIVSENNKRVEL